MADTTPRISVIIPSTGETARLESMRRAIASLRGQRYPALDIVIALNGNRFDRPAMSELEAARDVTVTHCEEASLPRAIEAGREAVCGDFFCFLDDDDEYLEGAIQARLAPFLLDATLDMVATNGYRHDRVDIISVGDDDGSDPVSPRPLDALIEENWLASCGFLMRTSTVPAQFFRDLPKYIEWTALGFRLMLAGKRLVYVNVPTWRYFYTDGSLSTRPEAKIARAEFLRSLLVDSRLPRRVRPAVRRKLCSTLHTLSVDYLARNQRALAWKYHAQSLAFMEGLKFISYTRRLIGRQPAERA